MELINRQYQDLFPNIEEAISLFKQMSFLNKIQILHRNKQRKRYLEKRTVKGFFF